MLKNGYNQLDFRDRVTIETLIGEGKNFSYIASTLMVSRATITREIRRGVRHTNYPLPKVKREYSAERAQYQVDSAKHNKGRKTILTPHKIDVIRNGILNLHLSPEQLIMKYPKLLNMSVSTIYNWINQNKIPGVLASEHLHFSGKRKRKAKKLSRPVTSSGKKAVKTSFKKVKTIEKRPDRINKRLETGHWEMDGVESKLSKDILITFVERKTRYQVIYKSASKKKEHVLEAVKGFVKDYGNQVYTITCDNGSEFLNRPVIQYLVDHDIDLYYAHPYSSYERGTNERTNRNIREKWAFPKGTNFSKISLQYIRDVSVLINSRPLKVLKGKTPQQLFKRFRKFTEKRERLKSA